MAHARTLGVHRVYLWQVLTGRQRSHSLLFRYRTLVAQERAAVGAGQSAFGHRQSARRAKRWKAAR